MNKKSIKALSLLIAFTLIFSAITVNASKAENQTRTIVDMAGRKVAVPEAVNKVYSMGPSGTILLYTLCPDKIVGVNYEFTPRELKFVPYKYKKLPVLGGWFGKNNTGNIEEILKAKPDFILSYGTIDKTAISTVEKIQKQLSIPIVMVDSNLEKSYKAYEFVGDIVNEKERAKVLADYSKAIINEVKEKAGKLPQKKVRIYYAEGAEGLQTEGRNSIRTLVSDMVGGLNVAGISTTTDYGKSPVSIENVLAWGPEVILVGSDPSGEHKVQSKIMNDKRWAGIKAVKNKKVYEIPHGPFNWYDRPDSVNRLIGLKWMGNLFYPDVFDYDMKKEAKKFYKEFYHIDLTDEQLKDLLGNAYNPIR
ncbi:ABC transporter substrate-binding protein [Lutispora saccharofermentans]|uniref:ABC transporter substrate-binding protein n=1 Tax=Lutispora saccharofermentans TaxID=3024236 RepID=A0ABT1NCU5_9FIRM|nr:ABC transporter substrate-binding protein [Lutispora saccharofermentans]MCQ1528864.1 ABC transporter substrate-binding protein [Lutispora saccharofermentans]